MHPAMKLQDNPSLTEHDVSENFDVGANVSDLLIPSALIPHRYRFILYTELGTSGVYGIGTGYS